ncbi:MAG TPA: hypothetical protein PLW65_03840 [Pseudomonadota bacterium]|nr:hypothetical protein [Pseudomonadota bacterium]
MTEREGDLGHRAADRDQALRGSSGGRDSGAVLTTGAACDHEQSAQSEKCAPLARPVAANLDLYECIAFHGCLFLNEFESDIHFHYDQERVNQEQLPVAGLAIW